jgi:hypothetical protein
LQPQRWDIPLDGVITEQCFLRLPQPTGACR